ncbi:MAG: insulinase family protein, partial [Deltaproteobacteria bacterium]|nr:insulinase family protein [Deltaproteobacteria bacterium]
TRAAFERAGATLAIATGVDDTTLAVDTLAATLAPSVALLADAVRRPDLAPAEVARRRAARVAELRAVPAEPRQIAAAVFERRVLAPVADHPYAHATRGVPEQVARETAATLRQFWRGHYGPATTTIVVAGDVDRATLEPLLAAAFATWRGGPALTPPPPPPPPAPPSLVVVDRAGAPTSVIVVGMLGPASDDPDYAARELASAVLASNDGRLDQRLRDQLALTAAVRGAFWRARGAGLWSASAAVDRDRTAEALREVLAAIAAMRTTPVPAAELDRARARLLRAVPRELETTAGTATAFDRLASLALPLDFYATYRARLTSLTADDVRAAADRSWRDPSIIVVGDWATLRAPLEALGLPVHEADSRGREVAP